MDLGPPRPSNIHHPKSQVHIFHIFGAFHATPRAALVQVGAFVRGATGVAKNWQTVKSRSRGHST
jgi:hypothetical protein